MPPERPPSPDAIMRCIAAVQRAQAALANDDELASDEQVLALALDFDPTMLRPDDMLRRTVEAIVSAEDQAELAERKARQMKARQARYEARAMVFRTEMLDMMLALERARFTGSPHGTVSVIPGRPKPHIPDESRLPEEYFRTEIVRTLDRRELLDDLKQGVVVEGATLTNGPPYLRITGQREES
jgi:hypothetical protein